MLIKLNDNYFVNLKTISYIECDPENLRAMFIYDYSVKLNNIKTEDGHLKTISDYKYKDFKTKEEYLNFFNNLKNTIESATDLKTLNFKELKNCESRNCTNKFYFVNLDHLSFAKIQKLDDFNSRLILNFDNGISFNNKISSNQITGAWLYFETPNDEMEIIRENLNYINCDSVIVLNNKNNVKRI